MSELLEGWQASTVGECFLEIKNGTTAAQNKLASGTPVSRIETIQKNTFDLSRIQHIEEPSNELVEAYKYQDGDIAFSHINSLEHVGKTALYEGKPETLIHGMNLLRLRRGHEYIYPKFAHYFMLSKFFREEVRKRVGHAVNQVSINQKNLSEVPFVLAPLNEQRRIVAKLEKLLSRVDAARSRLATTPQILKRFRQSLLAAACSGRLTADWRRDNKTLQTGAELVASLRAQTPEPHFDTFEKSSDAELPKTWTWAPLGKLGQMIGGGTPTKGNQEYWNGSVPWVSPKDMKRDRVSNSEDRITNLAVKHSSVRKIPQGSVLFVVRGMILNHTLPVAITDSVVTLNQDMKAVAPELPEMSEYLFIASKHIAKAILFDVKEATHGTRRIETPILKNWGIPIPPLPEQQEIVRRVQALFKTAEALEARYRKAKVHVDKLTQSILAKAFRGELVPQDPNDEPASVLLERIKSNRNSYREAKAVVPSRKRSAVVSKKKSPPMKGGLR